MPRTQDSEAMYCIPAIFRRSPKPFKTLVKRGFERPEENVAERLTKTLEILRENNNSSVSPVPKDHLEQFGQSKKQPRPIENPWGNNKPPTLISCRASMRPWPLHGCPKTFRILWKINNSRSRSRPVAANNELARLEHVAKFRKNPIEIMLFTHCRVCITTQTERAGCAGGTGQI